MKTYPVYKPFNKVQTYMGLQAKHWGKVILVAIIGVALFLMLGTVKTTVEEGISVTDKNIYLSSYSEALKTFKTVEQKIEFEESKVQDITPEQQKEVRAAVLKSLSEDQLEQYNFAQEKKMTRDMGENDLASIIPKTKEVEAEVFPAIPRAIILILIPAGLTVGWYLDLRGFTLSSEFKRYNKFRKRKALKVSKKNQYLGYSSWRESKNV